METASVPVREVPGGAIVGPHSLGTPIEWKHFLIAALVPTVSGVPTRWGHQLNGNVVGLA